MSKYTSVFGNEMPKKVIAKAEKTKARFIRKFGDDGNVKYTFSAVENEVLAPLGTKVLVKGDGARFSDRSVIIGNIRMGFGHYRISMAMASCAHALGFEPVWLDLNSFPDSTCTKLISYQNDLYSMGSRLSDKSRLFNKLYWEPLNSEGFRKLSYNACDQAASELTANLLRDLPKNVPFVATHAWPAQDLSVSSTQSPITGLWLCTLPRAVCTPCKRRLRFSVIKRCAAWIKNVLFARYRTMNLHTRGIMSITNLFRIWKMTRRFALTE